MPRVANCKPAAAAAALALCAGAALGQAPTITNMGILPGGALTSGLGISRDGKVAVGFCLVQPGGNRAVRWIWGTLQNLGVIAGGDASTATAVNVNGTVIVGQGTTSNGVRAFRWEDPGPMLSIGSLNNSSAAARGVSGNGALVVGDSATRAFLWT